ncbi:hypothetical protein Pelo_358 [Pelomyxa schiedti]|nr:hypothetical protein Pelo_358 [Pelomyxa schiedti]
MSINDEFEALAKKELEDQLMTRMKATQQHGLDSTAMEDAELARGMQQYLQRCKKHRDKKMKKKKGGKDGGDGANGKAKEKKDKGDKHKKNKKKHKHKHKKKDKEKEKEKEKDKKKRKKHKHKKKKKAKAKSSDSDSSSDDEESDSSSESEPSDSSSSSSSESSDSDNDAESISKVPHTKRKGKPKVKKNHGKSEKTRRDSESKGESLEIPLKMNPDHVHQPGSSSSSVSASSSGVGSDSRCMDSRPPDVRETQWPSPIVGRQEEGTISPPSEIVSSHSHNSSEGNGACGRAERERGERHATGDSDVARSHYERYPSSRHSSAAHSGRYSHHRDRETHYSDRDDRLPQHRTGHYTRCEEPSSDRFHKGHTYDSPTREEWVHDKYRDTRHRHDHSPRGTPTHSYRNDREVERSDRESTEVPRHKVSSTITAVRPVNESQPEIVDVDALTNSPQNQPSENHLQSAASDTLIPQKRSPPHSGTTGDLQHKKRRTNNPPETIGQGPTRETLADKAIASLAIIPTISSTITSTAQTMSPPSIPQTQPLAPSQPETVEDIQSSLKELELRKQALELMRQRKSQVSEVHTSPQINTPTASPQLPVPISGITTQLSNLPSIEAQQTPTNTNTIPTKQEQLQDDGTTLRKTVTVIRGDKRIDVDLVVKQPRGVLQGPPVKFRRPKP